MQAKKSCKNETHCAYKYFRLVVRSWWPNNKLCLVRIETNIANLSCFAYFFAVQQYLEVMDEKLHLGILNYLLAVLVRKIISDISDAAFGALCGTKYKGNSKISFFRLHKEIQAYRAPCKPRRVSKMKPTVRVNILE